MRTVGKLFKRVRRDDPRWESVPWQMRFRGSTGRWVDQTTDTTDEKKARKKLGAREAEVEAGKFAQGGRARFEDVATHWLDHYSAVRLRSHAENQRNFDNHLKPAFGALALRNIMPGAIRDFASEKIRDGLSPATVRRLLALLRKILNDAVQDGLLAESPFRRVKHHQLPREPKARDYTWFTQEEIAKLLEAAEPLDRPFYATAVYTGLRRGELCGLRWADVDLAAGLVAVSRSYDKPTTKSGEPRKVPMGAKLRAILTAWKANCPPSPEGLVFPSHTPRRLQPDGPLVHAMRDGATVSHRFADLCEAAGVRALPFHSLRHSFATHFMRTGGDLYRLKAILGHSTITLTERYAHHSPTWARRDVNRLDFQPKGTGVVGIEAVRRGQAKPAGAPKKTAGKGTRKGSKRGRGVGKAVGISGKGLR